LEIGNNTLAYKVGCTDNMKNFVIVVTSEGKFEAILCRVDRDGAGASASIEAVKRLALDTGEVNWLIQCTNDAIVPAIKCEKDIS